MRNDSFPWIYNMQGGSSWLYIYPQGFRDLLLYIKKYYGNPPIYITENGTDLDTIDPIYSLLIWFKDLATKSELQ